jgi:hypothetical protein
MRWTFGDKACHPERSEGAGSPDAQILSAAKDDSQDPAQVLSREVFSPNVWQCDVLRKVASHAILWVS